MTDGQIISIQMFHYCTKYLEEKGKQEKASELICPFKPEENKILKRFENLQNEQKFIELSRDKYEEYLGIKDGIQTMIEVICSEQDDDSQVFADQIVDDLHSLDNEEFYTYIYEAVCKVAEVLQITKYFTNLKKPNPNQFKDQPVSVPLILSPKNVLPSNQNNSQNQIYDDSNTSQLFKKPEEVYESNSYQMPQDNKIEEEQKAIEPIPYSIPDNSQIRDNFPNQNKINLFTFATEKNYQEKVENAIMKTQLRKKYERKLKNILEELEDDKVDIKTINDYFKELAEPSNISHLNDLIIKLKEITSELGLDLEKEVVFKLTDSEISALNLFYKIQNHLEENPDLLSGLKCPVELPQDQPEKKTTFLEILTEQQYQQLVENSITSANQKLKRMYQKKYYQILDIIDEEVDFEDINEILQELAQSSQNNFINEIKEQIILNLQQKEIKFNIESPMVLTESEIIALNMFFKVKDQLINKPDLSAKIICPIKIPEPIPEVESEKIQVIDYWLRFQSLENEEIFIQLSEGKFDNNKKRKDMIKKKIKKFMECIQCDSEEGIQDNQQEIKKQLERFDQNTEFLKYFKNELKNVFNQLKILDYFEEIITIEPEPIQPIIELDKIKLADCQDFNIPIDNSNSEFQKKIIDSSDVKPYDYQQMFQKDLMTLGLDDFFEKHSKILQIFVYFDSLRIRSLIKDKFPECQEQILKNLVEIMRKIGDYIEQEAPENQKENIINEINPLFVQIYEYENSQVFSSLQDQAPLQIYFFMVGLVQTACPQITIQKPLSLQDQQIEQFQQLKEFLPSLGKQITIQEYGTLDENSNIRDQIWALIKDFQNNNKLDGEKLLKILFDLIKRRVDFKELLQELSKIDNKNNLTQLILFQYILEHSDSQLKVLICITCAYFIPLPLLSFNPWQQNKEINKLQMIPEILYTFEKCKSLIQFKLSSNNQKFSQSQSLNGCTSLLNKLFGRQFSLHEHNLINFGTVEMQLDLNCADVEHFIVADTHGFIDIQNLKQIFPLFDGFIVHVDEKNFQDQEIQSNLDLLFREIPADQSSEKTILIIKHDSQNSYFELRQWQNINDKRLKVFEISTYNLSTLSDNQYQILIQSIHQALNSFFKLEVEKYKSTPEIRLESKQVFLNLLKQINNEQNIIKHQEAHDRLCKIINLIQNQENLKGTDFLPMLNYISRHSKLQDIITSENYSQKEKNDSRFELKQIQKAMKDEKSTEISDLYSEIIFNHQCMNLLPSLSSIVKGFLESKLKVIIEEREEIRNQILQTDIEQKEMREKLEQKFKDLNKAVDEKWFSTELLSRELFYLGQNSKKSSITKEDYYQLVRHFEQTAQPFELVDGDTLNFTTDAYQEVFQDYNNEDLLVVCVLGPQSSGKSLLMNYLFGTSFLSSSGRCTKGIYSSILRFKDKDGVYKRILILDTEGIQSSEARDTTFDKRIVYYAICVSHVVLMCNRGEMNAPMTETIKLVADAIVNTSMPFLKNPTIYIILNMLANPNDKTQLESIDELNRTLKELAAAASRKSNSDKEANQKQMVDQVLKINQDSLIPLGFAFNTFQFGSNIRRTVNKPSPEFAFKTMQLREKILQKFDEVKTSNSTKYSLRDWFNHAQNFWTFSRDCKSLKEYSSLGQKRIDDELMLEIERLIKDNFGEDVWKDVLQVYFDQELDKIFAQYQGGASVKFITLNQKTQEKIDDKYSEIWDKVINEYKNFCSDKVIPTDLSKKRQEILNRKKEQYKKEAERYTRKKLSKFIADKSKVVGDTILLEQCIKHLKKLEETKQDKYTVQEAKRLFNQSWKKSIDQIKKIIMKGDELTTRSIKTVTDEFKNLLNYTPGFENDYFKMVKTSKKQTLYEKMIPDFYKDGLMFIGDQFSPNIKLIIECQERTDKRYTVQEKVVLFENKTTYEYFRWWDYLTEILKADEFAQKISTKLQRQDLSLIQFFKNLIVSSENSQIRQETKKELNILINDFKKECFQLGFTFLRNENDLLCLFDKQGTNCSSEFIKNECKKFILQKENFSCNSILDPYKNLKIYRGSYSSRYDIAREMDLKYFEIYNFKKRTYTDITQFYEQFSQRKQISEYFPIKSNSSLTISQNVRQELQKDKQIQNKYGGSSYNPFYYYLDYLKNPQYQRAVQSMNQAGQEYFFKAIEWKNVFEDVELVILKNYKVNGEIQGNDQIQNYVDILSKNDESSEALASDFNKMGPKLAKGIFRDVNEIIKKIDSEIEAFCMKISEKGKIFIFLVTQILTFLLTEQLEIISESSPLRQFMGRKKYEKKLFIAKLTLDDAELDKSLGIKLAEELCTKIYQQCKQRTVIKFQSLMKEKADDFRKVNFISDLEEQCENLHDKLEANSGYVPLIQEQTSKKELIDYYFDPKVFLEEKFKQKFKEVTEDFLDNCKQEFFKSYQVKIGNLFDYFDRTLKKFEQTKINKSSTIIFQPVQSQSTNLRKQIDAGQVKYETLQKNAARQYLNLLLSNQWNNDSQITVDGFQFVCLDEFILPQSIEIQNPENKQFDDEIYEIITENLEKDNEISQIHKFIGAIIDFINKNETLEKYLKFQISEPQEDEKNIEDEQNQINSSDDDDILDTSHNSGIQGQEDLIESDQIYSQTKPKMDVKKIKQNREDVIKDEELIGEHLQDYKIKFLGCYEVCPLCRKQCDQAHDENLDDVNLTHDCQMGHQLQGFGGNKSYDDEVAITYSCNNIRDQDIVFYKGQDKQWLELKNGILKNWNYNKDQSQVDLARKTQVKLWNLLGPEVCRRYQREQGLRIEFQKAEEKVKMGKSVGNVHYILMLDDSGSMSGTPWSDLMNSVQTFLSMLASNQEQRNNGKVTCINHNQTAVLYFQEQIPDRSLANMIRFRSGGNDFDPPLNMAFNICQSTHQKYDKIIYYFMSDGIWTFPTQAVNNHKRDSTFQNKIEFYSVGFGPGADMNILKQIADQMPNGKVVKALTAKELTESFKKIVINLYGEQ